MTEQTVKGKRIAMVSNNAWSVYNFRLDVIRSLIAEGHRVVVISPEDEYVSLLEQEGCRFITVKFDNRSVDPVADFQFYLRLKQVYRSEQPDIIFHFVAKPNIYGSLAAKALRIPSVAVVTGLGYAFARKNWLYYFVRSLYKIALKGAGEVWFLNNEDARVFSKEGIVEITKIKVLPGEGVNTSFFQPFATANGGRPLSTRFRFLMACRLLRSKGVGVYAEACRILKRKGFQFDAVLIGFFEAHHPDSITSEELDKWQAEGLLRYLGFSKDVRSMLAEADCFVFPSYYHEGVPRCLMEAASMELPVITTRNRGCREVVVEGVTGLLCQTGDPFDLADKMEMMLSMPQASLVEMGKKGRDLVVGKFDVSRVVAEYKGVIAQLGS
ncbi:glycosyltransferase family 4 protein [Flavihumibacter rivuli]|uniref:glycosyltransferase family 4 protein n=1 Tax=Flavihumibacter rivuli TaxID=2838156 RepID=UPI001BDE8C2F|nr:glycosyltransferase family 4 protein [Flavihumibacter rivuli]ULQ58083.1 glycosyltransferase family 4 protein [Flavihumibacter rivuli]